MILDWSVSGPTKISASFTTETYSVKLELIHIVADHTATVTKKKRNGDVRCLLTPEML